MSTRALVILTGLILRKGLVGGQELLGLMIYFSLVLVVSVKAGLELRAWIFPHTFIFIIGSFLLCYALLPIASVLPLTNNGLFGTAMALYSEPFFWLLQPLVLVLCLLPDVVWLVARRTFWPDAADLIGDAESVARATPGGDHVSPDSMAQLDHFAELLSADGHRQASPLSDSVAERSAQAVSLHSVGISAADNAHVRESTGSYSKPQLQSTTMFSEASGARALTTPSSTSPLVHDSSAEEEVASDVERRIRKPFQQSTHICIS